LGGGDPSGCVYFLDDGRSYVVPESPFGSTLAVKVVDDLDEVPELDMPRVPHPR
jgi:hypothetical protein